MPSCVLASRQHHKGVIPFYERNHCFELFLLKVFITQELCATYQLLLFSMYDPRVTFDVLAPVSAILALIIRAYKMVLNGIKSIVLTAKNITPRFLLGENASLY